jgi:hypothetical protein
MTDAQLATVAFRHRRRILASTGQGGRVDTSSSDSVKCDLLVDTHAEIDGIAFRIRVSYG